MGCFILGGNLVLRSYHSSDRGAIRNVLLVVHHARADRLGSLDLVLLPCASFHTVTRIIFSRFRSLIAFETLALIGAHVSHMCSTSRILPPSRVSHLIFFAIFLSL